MNGSRVARLSACATALVVFAAVLAGYAISRTPGDTLGRARGPVAARTIGADGQADYTLPKESSAAKIGDDLEELGIIRSGAQFALLVRLMGVEKKLSAGEYTLPKGISAVTAVQAVTVKDSVPVRRVTFPEGIRIEEMAVIAEKAGFGTAQEFLVAAAAAKLPSGLALNLPAGAGLQGYLFPDTYILPIGARSPQLVALMIETFDVRFSAELRAAAAQRGFSTHEVVTMASIVEREAVLEGERPRIAGVFYNRLAGSDSLGADPTVQFAITVNNPATVTQHGWWKKELTAVDLDSQSPYNTRKFGGLPPGPITNPGLASLEAAAKPEATDFYYFVADAKKGDGSHAFAVTFAEHEGNIATVGSP